MTKIQTKIWREGSLLAGVDCRPTRRLICIAWQGCFQRRRPFTCYKAGMRCMSLFLDFRPSVGWLIFIFPLAPFIQAEFTLFSSSIPQALLLGFLLSSFLIFFFFFFFFFFSSLLSFYRRNFIAPRTTFLSFPKNGNIFEIICRILWILTTYRMDAKYSIWSSELLIEKEDFGVLATI